MKIKIIHAAHMGFPARLQGQTVEAERYGSTEFRLTARNNHHLHVTQKWIDQGHAEIIPEYSVEDLDAWPGFYP